MNAGLCDSCMRFLSGICSICRFALRGRKRVKLAAMRSGPMRCRLMLVCASVFACGAFAQTTSTKPAQMAPAPVKTAPPPRIEPGLENAVKWKWRVAPSDAKDWGLELPHLTAPLPAATPVVARPQPENRTNDYEVKRGDALIRIGKRFGMTVDQLKEFNGLKDDKIRVGQILRIPTAAELSAMTPPAQPASAPTANRAKPVKPAGPKPGSEAATELDNVRLQVFLDREQFSAGPIVGKPGPAFKKVVFLYQSTHEDAKDDASLGAKAQAAVGNPFTRYRLKAEDFRFISPPKAQTAETKFIPVAVPVHPKKHRVIAAPPVIQEVPWTYEQLTGSSMLAYRTAWDFVAERFHCNESYLRSLNEKLPVAPAVGTEFRVPNVIPFEIEKAFDEPLQPQADPKDPVTAAVVGLSQLNVYRGSTLVAVMPFSVARPGLRGRGFWTILDVIPRPRLGTFQEDWKDQTKKPPTLYGVSTPQPLPTPFKPKLSSEQFLAAGPRNPAGIFWINLAKANSKEPLPYGLHGTSIPDQMNVLESLGGFRLTNWDIARAVRLLPPGTPLEWKQ